VRETGEQRIVIGSHGLLRPIPARSLVVRYGLVLQPGGRAERCHPLGRERMGSPSLQTLQDPILLLCLGSAFELRLSKPQILPSNLLY
jgi:hypothetical protein